MLGFFPEQKKDLMTQLSITVKQVGSVCEHNPSSINTRAHELLQTLFADCSKEYQKAEQESVNFKNL